MVKWSGEGTESKWFKVGLECGMWSDEEPGVLTPRDGKKEKGYSSSRSKAQREGEKIQGRWN